MTTATVNETDCTITHDGHSYTAEGAYVDGERAVVYVKSRTYPNGETMPERRHVPVDLTDWHGNVIGYAITTSQWKVRSYIGTHMYSYRAVINGERYNLRGFGNGMVATGKRSRAV